MSDTVPAAPLTRPRSAPQRPRPPKFRNGAGVASLILGVLAVVFSFIPLVGMFIAMPMAVVGAFLGVLGIVFAAKGRANNRGQSIAGLVLSVVALGLSIAFAIFASIVVNAVDESAQEFNTSMDKSLQEFNDSMDKALEEPGESDGAGEAAAPPAGGVETVVAPGEDVVIGGVTITASELRPAEDASGTYLCAPVSYRNGTAEPALYNVLEWSLEDPAGNVVRTAFAGSAAGLTAGSVAAGAEKAGDICFETQAQEASGGFTLRLENSGGTGVWTDKP